MIIDTFLYFNEKELASLRIKYLNNIIDYFVVIEANITHQGKPKEWNFEKILNGELRSYKDKIQYHKIKIEDNEIEKNDGWIVENVKGGKSWSIENIQRNYIKNACKEFSNNDLVLISDVDEIPSLNKINFLLNCDFDEINPVGFEQSLFHLNCEYLNLEKWIGTTASRIETIQKFTPQMLRNNRWRITMLTQAGWSFSSFGSVEKIQEKFEAFAHQEYNNFNFKNKEHINNCLKNGMDLFHRNIKKKSI